ncbi:MAG: chloride channel protein, partial [Chromatiales bacterium]|nr:chloride channel protein [Chromatiales bacterium]
NATRTLVACGIAAAIGASFNTPLAGVIFAMEVVMMEYAIASFAPIILAAVSATALTRLVYGDSPAFIVPPLELGSVAELPYMVLVGIAVGVGAALFIRSIRYFSESLTNLPIWQRATLGGILVALIAIPFPQVMGIGYDTVNSALIGEIGIGLLLAISLAKIIATTGVLGLGIPGGLIGPTLVVGATLGAAMGAIGAELTPELASSPTLYALIGMGAMMGATLHAPLAALIAMLELSANPNILLPGMLAVISAGLVCSELFGQRSIFLTLLKVRGLDYRNDPVTQQLRSIGVTAEMDRAFVFSTPKISYSTVKTILDEEPTWLLYRDDEQPLSLIKAVDLASHIQRLKEDGSDEELHEQDIDLNEIPAASRIHPLRISSHATLQDALEQLNRLEDRTTYALCIVEEGYNGSERLSGVLTRRDIENYYQL